MQFFVGGNLDSWHPKTHGPRNYLQSFHLAALIQKCGGKSIIHMQSSEMLLQEKGQDHLIMKVITMELLHRLLIMKRHPNLRTVKQILNQDSNTSKEYQNVVVVANPPGSSSNL